MRDRYRRLRMAGFEPAVAIVMAEAGYDVLGFVPLGWPGLPVDELLTPIGGAA